VDDGDEDDDAGRNGQAGGGRSSGGPADFGRLGAAMAQGWALTVAAQARAFAALGEDSVEADALWRMAETQADGLRTLAAQLARLADSPPGAATLERFLDPGQWLFGGFGAPDPALRRLIAQPAGGEEMGRAGLSRTPEARALTRALNRHRALVAAAFARMAETFAAALAAHPAPTLEAMQAHWIRAARALDDLHASDAFLASQAQVVQAALALRAVEAAMVEAWCAERGLPTRAEVDALQRAVAELRREIRILRRRHDDA
jgi:hypothetical protein